MQIKVLGIKMPKKKRKSSLGRSTANKSQGQTLKHCGLYLENECFSHGQFYVGVSRVGSQKNLKIYAPENKTVNIVYQEILQD